MQEGHEGRTISNELAQPHTFSCQKSKKQAAPKRSGFHRLWPDSVAAPEGAARTFLAGNAKEHVVAEALPCLEALAVSSALHPVELGAYQWRGDRQIVDGPNIRVLRTVHGLNPL